MEPNEFSSHEGPDVHSNREWDPNKALESLATERVVFNADEDEVKAADRLLREGLVPAVASVIHTSVYSTNERLRLDASKYVIDRQLGRIPTDAPATAGSDPLLQLLGDAVTELAASD